jgi:hypothetical protein
VNRARRTLDLAADFVASMIAPAALIALFGLGHFVIQAPPEHETISDRAAARYVWLSSYGLTHRCEVDGFGPDGPVAAGAAVEHPDGTITLEPFAAAWADYLAGQPGGDVLLAACLDGPPA